MSDTPNAALGPMARYLVQALGIVGLCDEYRSLRDQRLDLARAERFEDVVDEYGDLGDELDDVAYEIARALIDAAGTPDECERRLLDASELRRLRAHGGMRDA